MGRAIRKIGELMHAWNAFDDAPREISFGGQYAQSPRANRSQARYYNDRSFVGSILNRLAVDWALIEFYHAKLDENDVAIEIVRDDLNRCLTLDPNIDQSAFALKVDYAMTMFEQGTVVLAPVDASMDPLSSSSYDIKNMRVATIAAWHPRHVTINLYDDRQFKDDGQPNDGGVVKQVTMPKEHLVIQENPFYTVMNEPNGLLQRLMRKLSILDGIDEAAGSGKLDMILQLPYTVRGENRQAQAAKRRDELREQLKDDELGLGYIDVSEKVIQLNRPIENKLLEQVQLLMGQVMSEMGLTDAIMNGSADRNTINNYYDRTIEPIAHGFSLETKRKFLTKTAITQRHSIEYYRDPLKLIPIDELAEVADKLIRNAVITVNELRPKIGYRPSKDPNANKLINPNMPVDDQLGGGDTPPAPTPKEVTDEGLPGDAQA